MAERNQSSYHGEWTIDIFWQPGLPGHCYDHDCYGSTSGYFVWAEADWGTNGLGIVTSGVNRGVDVCGEKGAAESWLPYAAPTTWPGVVCDVGISRVEADQFHPRERSVSRTVAATFQLRTGGKALSRRQSLFVLGASVQGIRNPFWPEVDPQTPDAYDIDPARVTLGALGKLGTDGKRYAALPDNETRDITPQVANAPGYYTWTYAAPSKHRPYITANGIPLSPHRVVTWADRTWVGEVVEFSTGFAPPMPIAPEKETVWSLPGPYVNKINLLPHDCVEYTLNTNLLLQNDTWAWWVWGGGTNQTWTNNLGCVLWTTFANGQRASLTVRGKLGMNKPTVVSADMCADYTRQSPLPQPHPCLFLFQPSPDFVRLGEYEVGGYARCYTAVAARPGDRVQFTQLVQTTVVIDGVTNLTTGTSFWLDGPIGRNCAAATTVATNGLGIIAFKDRPGRSLLGQSTTRSDAFRVFFQYKPNSPNSIPVTLGRVDWGWGFEAIKPDDTWGVIPVGLAAPVWLDDHSFPKWDNVMEGQIR